MGVPAGGGPADDVEEPDAVGIGVAGEPGDCEPLEPDVPGDPTAVLVPPGVADPRPDADVAVPCPGPGAPDPDCPPPGYGAPPSDSTTGEDGVVANGEGLGIIPGAVSAMAVEPETIAVPQFQPRRSIQATIGICAIHEPNPTTRHSRPIPMLRKARTTTGSNCAPEHFTSSCARSRNAERPSIRADRRHDLIRVRDGDDTAGERDAVSGKLVRVTEPVPSLVVMLDRVCPFAQPAPQGADETRPFLGMLAHRVELGAAERGGLREDLARHEELADVVKQRCPAEARAISVWQLHLVSDHVREDPHAFRVPAGLAVVDAQCGDQLEDALHVRDLIALDALVAQGLQLELQVARATDAPGDRESLRSAVREQQREAEKRGEREQPSRGALHQDDRQDGHHRHGDEGDQRHGRATRTGEEPAHARADTDPDGSREQDDTERGRARPGLAGAATRWLSWPARAWAVAAASLMAQIPLRGPFPRCSSVGSGLSFRTDCGNTRRSVVRFGVLWHADHRIVATFREARNRSRGKPSRVRSRRPCL